MKTWFLKKYSLYEKVTSLQDSNKCPLNQSGTPYHYDCIRCKYDDECLSVYLMMFYLSVPLTFYDMWLEKLSWRKLGKFVFFLVTLFLTVIMLNGIGIVVWVLFNIDKVPV